MVQLLFSKISDFQAYFDSMLLQLKISVMDEVQYD